MTLTQLLVSAFHRCYQSSYYIAQHSEVFTALNVSTLKTEAVRSPEAPLRPLHSARSHDSSQPLKIKTERSYRRLCGVRSCSVCLRGS